MVHAVLFNPKAFDSVNLIKILEQTGGNYEGIMVKKLWNCMESFPDGRIYKSFVRKDELDGKNVIDCGDDLERFIYVNKYGLTNQDEDMEYENLVQKVQDGEMTFVEFIEAQEELNEEWKEWLAEYKLEPTEANANAFLSYHDNLAMGCQSLG